VAKMNNIKMDLKATGCKHVDWILLVTQQCPFVGSCKHGNVHFGFRRRRGIS
jgi:hypothetical protein